MKHIEHLRKIRATAIEKLGDETFPSTSGGETDHSHANKSLLDSLSADEFNKLMIAGIAVNVPLLQEAW